MSKVDGMVGEANTCARNPFPGRSENESQFSWEAWKNQLVLGRVGRRKGFPPNPSDMPNGSFHRPKPQVPGMESLEVRADRLRLNEKRWGNCLLGRSA